MDISYLRTVGIELMAIKNRVIGLNNRMYGPRDDDAEKGQAVKDAPRGLLAEYKDSTEEIGFQLSMINVAITTLEDALLEKWPEKPTANSVVGGRDAHTR